MTATPEASSWPGASPDADSGKEHPLEFERIWRGFMAARATLGLVLVVLQASILVLAPQQSPSALVICVAYFAATLTLRLKARPRQLSPTFDSLWLRTVGVDVLTFSVLQWAQGGAINYTPLLALPVLMVSILGTPLQAIASAAGVTLLLFGYAGWLSLQTSGDFTGYVLQAALTGAGCFAISFIASQMATRLASVELRAKRSQLAATVQQQVNQLVIASLTDGIMVVSENGKVLLANPAAHALLDTQGQTDINLKQRLGWSALMDVINSSFNSQRPQQASVDIRHQGHTKRSLLARTQLTSAQDDNVSGLCVVFMQDQREIEARIRAEKLAGMGRMSAAVAHEIRNPLAAITQANALLSEDLQDPGQRRLADMVQQNARRLERIVKDVLHLVQVPTSGDTDQLLDLATAAQRIGRDWSSQNHCIDELSVHTDSVATSVLFDAEHLRRIVINLLDNALRYASRAAGSIQMHVAMATPSNATSIALHVWSDGAALDPSVEQHLFEPFFSSESRSSGLGLYICRELCESHGATIAYDRRERKIGDQRVTGNEFTVTFKTTNSTLMP